jgi:hypothetical protein
MIRLHNNQEIEPLFSREAKLGPFEWIAEAAGW